MSPPEWPDDPLFDPDDPAAVEREERRREREAKRAQRDAKRGKKETPAAPPPKPAAPPAPPRTPEQEFWDEDPEPAPSVPGQEPAAPRPDAPDPGMVERGRRRLLGRRRGKDATPRPPATPRSTAEPNSAVEPKPPVEPKPAAEAKTEVEPQVPAAPAAEPSAPREPTKPVAPAATKPAVDPARTSGGGASAVPVPVPPKDGAESPQGDSLGKAALGGAAGAAAAGIAGAAAAAGAADAQPGAGGKQPPTGEDGAMSDQPPTGEEPSPTGEQPISAGEGPATGGHSYPTGEDPPTGEDAPGTHEYAPPPAPPETPTAADFQPLVRDWDFHDEGDPEMAGAARAGRRRGEDGGKRRGGPAGALLRHPFRILAVVLLLLVLLFGNSLFQPFKGGAGGRVEVRIPKGSGVGEVGDLLEKRGVIDGSYLGLVNASTLFQMRVTLDGKRGDLIAGRHTLQKGMSYGDAISALSKEPSAKTKPGIVTVTIPEGYHRTETAKLVAEDGLKGSYVKATKKSKLLNPHMYGGKDAKDLEGFLFPDTWELKSGTRVKKLVALQLEDFKKQIKKVNMKYAKSKNLTVYDVVTIGSLVEGEAGLPKQRKLVASVIYNRLREGIPLGLDTTTRFATGNYAKPLTQTQLESSSPYNTRVVAGLPPGPISSPGLAALRAAAHPAKTGYFYYVNDPNSCGGLSFSKNEAEFEEDVQTYEAAREKAGGNAPSTCGE